MINAALLGGLMLAFTFLWWRDDRPNGLRFAASMGFMGVAIGCLLYQARQLRPKVLAEQRSAVLAKSRPPSFAGQALLILLPVVALAVLGFFAVHRDYRLTEQEARQRATDLAQDLSRRLGRALAGELSSLELLGNVWEGDGVIGGSVNWPGTSPLSAADQERYQLRLIQWQAEEPGFRPEDIFPVQARLTTSGTVEAPRDYPTFPEPAAWPGLLTPEQRVQWESLASRGRAGPEAAAVTHEAVVAFLSTDVSGEARVNAEFLALLSAPRTNSPATRVDAWIALGRKGWQATSESGLPLRSLTLARAMSEASEAGLTPAMFDELAEQARNAPSFLFPRLLADAEQLAVDQSAEARQALVELRARWDSDERLRALAREVQARLKPAGVLTTNLWFEWKTLRWLAVLDPGKIMHHTSSNGAAVTHTQPVTGIRFYPRPVVERALGRAVNKLNAPIPGHLELAAVLEGEPLLSPASTSTAAKPLVLARGETRLSQPGRFYRDDEPVQDPSAGREFETLPSQPRLEFELRLSDPAALYARALQRAAIFGAVVLAGLATALIGLFAAHRAFHRQLRLNEMKSNFVSSVSHELRAPIASVRLLAESLDRGKITDEGKRRDYFRLIGQECRRLSSLIENVLDFSRIDQGRKQYEFEPTDLTALVRQTVELMRPYAAERQVGLQFDPPATLNPQASLDGKAIQQALVNLIDNAVKHSPAATDITVALATPDSSAPEGDAAFMSPPNPDSGSLITLSVTDRGPGIPATEFERIFEPFHRLGSELRRETTGVGIGLSIVKHIVEAHRGRMRVVSEVGKGSRFVIELPFLAEQRAKA